MTTRITVRLPDDLVAFVDALVADGMATSREAIVREALERERRRAIVARDTSILAERNDDGDLQRLAEYTASSLFDLG